MKKVVLMIISALINFAQRNVKFLAIFLLAAGFFSCDRQTEPEEPYGDDDPPPIFDTFELKNVRLTKVVRFSNSTASKLTGEVVYTYNESGNLIKETYYDEWNGTMICIYFIEYEYLGNKKVKQSIFNCNNGLGLSSYTEYFFEGDLLVKEVHNTGREDTPTFYEYDERGNLVKRSWYGISPITLNPDPNTVYEHKYTYNDKDRLILEETSEIGVSDYYHKYLKYSYDNHDRVKKMEYYNVDNVLIKRVEKFYNKSNILEFHYGKDGKQTVKYQHFYDKWGNLTETVINDECSMFKRKYDGGLLIEEIHYWAHEYGYHGTGQMPESGMSRYEYEEL